MRVRYPSESIITHYQAIVKSPWQGSHPTEGSYPSTARVLPLSSHLLGGFLLSGFLGRGSSPQGKRRKPSILTSFEIRARRRGRGSSPLPLVAMILSFRLVLQQEVMWTAAYRRQRIDRAFEGRLLLFPHAVKGVRVTRSIAYRRSAAGVEDAESALTVGRNPKWSCPPLGRLIFITMLMYNRAVVNLQREVGHSRWADNELSAEGPARRSHRRSFRLPLEESYFATRSFERYSILSHRPPIVKPPQRRSR